MWYIIIVLFDSYNVVENKLDFIIIVDSIDTNRNCASCLTGEVRLKKHWVIFLKPVRPVDRDQGGWMQSDLDVCHPMHERDTYVIIILLLSHLLDGMKNFLPHKMNYYQMIYVFFTQYYQKLSKGFVFSPQSNKIICTKSCWSLKRALTN